jgi:DNA-binding transcriptional ArsR family regulator
MTVLHWDFGSAYDFFISLFVIHYPDRFGLRGVWAAGVRSRFSPEERVFIENTINFLPVPLSWVNRLSLSDKSTGEVLQLLSAIPPEKRLIALFNSSQLEKKVISSVERIQSEQKITVEDLEILRSIYQHRAIPIKMRDVQKLAEAFLEPAQFGENLLNVLQSYYQAFFAEEEERILPSLRKGLQFAQKLSKKTSLPDLLETLSHGVKLENTDIYQKVILVPSYWSSPLVFFNNPRADELLVVFGCRNETQNLVPGEYVPESLVTGLKALADPTRLRILHYLNQGTTTPSSLARRLRLRAPTVIHHLNTLRLAGLVQVTLTGNGERRYSLRQEAINDTFTQLTAVIKSDTT